MKKNTRRLFLCNPVRSFCFCRILVQDDIFDNFLEKFKQQVLKLKVISGKSSAFSSSRRKITDGLTNGQSKLKRLPRA